MRISDWSSDVCSSDLTAIDAAVEGAIRALPLLRHIICDLRVGLSKTGFTKSRGDREILTHQIQAKGPFARFRIFHHGNVADPVGRFEQQIGRASCRERVWQDV